MIVFALIVLYGLWASIFPYNKLLLTFSAPLFLTGSRMVIAGIFLLVYLLIQNRNSFFISRKKFLDISFLAVTGIYTTNALEAWGLQHLPAAKTCFIYSLSPFFTAIVSSICDKEKITLKKGLGLLIGFLGFFLVLCMQSNGLKDFSGLHIIAIPELSVIGATLCSVYGWILLRRIVKDESISPLFANGMSMLLGGILGLIHSKISENWNPLPIATGKINIFITGIAGVILVSNIICYNLYGYMLRHFTATFISFAGLLSPIFSSIISWLVLGEALSPILFISTFVIALGLWIIYKEELRLGYIRQESSEEKI